MEKRYIEISHYVVKEGPTGGWSVSVRGAECAISCHDDKASVLAAAKRYVAADKRRAA